MKPKSRPESSLLRLFQVQFGQLLNHDHPLFVLANQIDWYRFDAALADCYSPDQGAPAKAVRHITGSRIGLVMTAHEGTIVNMSGDRVAVVQASAADCDWNGRTGDAALAAPWLIEP